MDYDYGVYDNDLDDGDAYYYGSEEDEEIPALTLPQTYQLCLKPVVYDSVFVLKFVPPDTFPKYLKCTYLPLECMRVYPRVQYTNAKNVNPLVELENVLQRMNITEAEIISLKSDKTAIEFLFVVLFNTLLSKLFFTNSHTTQQIISIICGCLSLHSLFSTSVYYIISFVFITYALLFILTFFQLKSNHGVILILISLSYLCICELWLVDSRKTYRIRGPQMLVVMKSVSLAFDLDIGTIKEIPSLILYLGYILCPSSSVFGPWTSFNDYLYNFTEKWSFKSVQKILTNLLLALLFLTISTCWSDYFIPNGSWKWFIAFRDALSFRTSHYFICHLSEVTLLLSGYSCATHKAVTKPHKVEFPRSIVNVVVYWNIPMHNWLKCYIFNTSRKFGNFFAIISTYTVSSLLHGINFQLSAVLLSLGLYSYVEVMLRKKLASGFSACILAKDCKPDCSHEHKKYHPFVLLANIFLVLLTIFHLAYLGAVFRADGAEGEETEYTWTHTLSKWASLDYLSPYVAILTYFMYFIIK